MIRTAIREEQEHYRHRNVAKLLFMHMLGESGMTTLAEVDGRRRKDPSHWVGRHCLGRKSVGSVCVGNLVRA